MRIFAAASARLCVETLFRVKPYILIEAAASARLCVETIKEHLGTETTGGSRLRAAVC